MQLVSEVNDVVKEEASRGLAVTETGTELRTTLSISSSACNSQFKRVEIEQLSLQLDERMGLPGRWDLASSTPCPDSHQPKGFVQVPFLPLWALVFPL